MTTEFKQESLVIPIQRNLPVPASHRVHVEMSWLPTIQDRTHDVWRQQRHS